MLNGKPSKPSLFNKQKSRHGGSRDGLSKGIGWAKKASPFARFLRQRKLVCQSTRTPFGRDGVWSGQDGHSREQTGIGFRLGV
jgi:hypothetical protein